MSTPIEPSPSPRWNGWRRWLRRTPTVQSDASLVTRQRDHDLVMSLSTRRIPSWKQLTALPSVLQPTERQWVRLWGALAIVSLLTLITIEIVGHVGTAPQAGGTLTEAIVGTPQFINPVLARPGTADGQLAELAFRGLFRVNRDLRIVPDLAQSFTQSADGKVYTIILHSGLQWSDGEKLTTADVVYTYQTLADSQFKSPWLGNVQGLKVTTSGANTVVFTFPQSSQANWTTLTLGLIPSHLWADQTGQTFSLAELNTKPVGNGPMKFSSLSKDHSGQIKSMTFVRNKLYHGAATLIDRLVFKFYPDQDSAVQALNNSAVDSLADVPSDSAATVAKHSTVTPIPVSQLVGIFFNQHTSPLLSNNDIRRALAMSVDRQDIVDHALSHQAVANDSPLVPDTVGYNPDLKNVGSQLDLAKTALDTAGWKAGSDGIRVKGKQKFAFTLTTVDEADFRAVAEALTARWQLLGASVTVKYVDPTQVERDVIRPRQYEALLFGQQFSADGDPFAYWDSSEQRDPGFALSIFFNKNIDKDLEDAYAATKADQRQKDLLDFQNLVIDQTPAIMLYQSTSLYAHPHQLRGFNDQHFVASANRFDDISSWYLRTSLTWTSKKK